MVTIRDVAKKSGVSVGTVSAVLNNKSTVSPQTRERVLQVMRELEYEPNQLAQGLVTKSNKTIGLMVYGNESMNFLTNPLFFDIIKHLNLGLSAEGYKAMLHFVLLKDLESEIRRIAHSMQNDAIIIMNYRHSADKLRSALDGCRIPCMTLVNDFVDDSVLSIAVDNVQCAKHATRFLLQKGHRRIAFVGKADDHTISRSRLTGYLEALGEYGVESDPALILEGDFFRESGAEAARHILSRLRPLPTAIFAANDLMAMGIYEELMRQKVEIPRQMSLIGMDDLPGVDLYAVPLTTINISGADIGRLAAQKITGVLRGQDALPNHVTVGFTLIERASVATFA